MEATDALKIVIVGEGGVGKSSITMAILKRDFNDSGDYDPTIEDSYTVHTSVEGTSYSIELIDTAGQEEYRNAWNEGHCRDAHGFILCYSIDDQKSFDLLPDFLHIIRKARSTVENPSTMITPENTPFPLLVLGNKCDKAPQHRTVSAQQGLAFARQAGGLFYECSAQSRANIDASFQLLVKNVAMSVQLRRDFLEKLPSSRKKTKDDLLIEGLGFNANVAVLDKARGRTRMTGQSSPVSRVSTTQLAFNENGVKRKPRNPDLVLDRKRSRSIGGLGLDPAEYHGGKKQGCGCIVS
ncbi:hypothetical protein OIV83_004819 [Microbotryomycetes sp. JL201]|nr:hypothetical protein OIV83_004819 [Microbotryomycetes sp. JL201]